MMFCYSEIPIVVEKADKMKTALLEVIFALGGNIQIVLPCILSPFVTSQLGHKYELVIVRRSPIQFCENRDNSHLYFPQFYGECGYIL